MQCPSCGSRDIDFHEAGGHSACVKCGTVVEENVIVSSIEFQVRERLVNDRGKSDDPKCYATSDSEHVFCLHNH
jgi:transcription initiation factor TFIIIB Brf1 subunit/transcription initiation factor TFIIB